MFLIKVAVFSDQYNNNDLVVYDLTQLRFVSHLYIPQKYQKTRGLLTSLEG